MEAPNKPNLSLARFEPEHVGVEPRRPVLVVRKQAGQVDADRHVSVSWVSSQGNMASHSGVLLIV